MIKDTGDRTPMGDTGFVRDAHIGKGRMDLLPWPAIIELSKHCEEGAFKYGERNIDKGAPLHSLLDSCARHMAKLMSGQLDEDHLRALCWNAMWALNQRTTHPELNDTPWKDYKELTEDSESKTLEELCSSCRSCASCIHSLESNINPAESCFWCQRKSKYEPRNFCPDCGRPLTLGAQEESKKGE